MDEKQKKLLPNRSSFRRSMAEQDRAMNHFSSTINDPSDLYSNHQHSMYPQTILPIPLPPPTTGTSRKRSRQDECPIQRYDQHIQKRIRCEPSNSIELENQPPRATIKRRSLFLYHPKHDWNHLQLENHIASPFNQLSPSISTYQPFNSEYSSNLISSSDHHTGHFANMFGNGTFMTSSPKNACPKSSMNMVKSNIRLFPTQADVPSPLRTTNFVLDGKQQSMSATIMRTGNVSPAHSDTSTESTSTCSSDEQHFHLNFSTLHSQPSRSYRERENYEQLLDLAEKLADPNRLEKVDIEQFLSYRYKTITATNDIFSSKQTACVICMSPFKNGQHIRVLPCQHEYHSKCIAQWFTMNSSCPICRRDHFLSNCT